MPDLERMFITDFTSMYSQREKKPLPDFKSGTLSVRAHNPATPHRHVR